MPNANQINTSTTVNYYKDLSIRNRLSNTCEVTTLLFVRVKRFDLADNHISAN